jgi:excinuclease UvrABC helicase subunit UvrB
MPIGGRSSLVILLRVGQAIGRDTVLARLVDLQSTRNAIAFERGQFNVGRCFQPASE